VYSVSTVFRLIQYKIEGKQLHFHISRHIAHLMNGYVPCSILPSYGTAGSMIPRYLFCLFLCTAAPPTGWQLWFNYWTFYKVWYQGKIKMSAISKEKIKIRVLTKIQDIWTDQRNVTSNWPHCVTFVISKKLYFKKCDKLSRFSLWYKFARYSPWFSIYKQCLDLSNIVSHNINFAITAIS
jgi:hypothetical protein